MRDPRRAALTVFGVVVALGLAGLLATAALDERRLAFTLGVQPARVAAVLEPGATACQRPIYVPADAGSVKLPVDTFGAPGPRLAVLTTSGGRGSVPAGYRGPTTVSASPGGIVAGQRIGLCVRNAGRRKVALYGGAPQAARTSKLFLDGRDAGTDLALVFERDEPRSMLAAFGDVFDRAALFNPGWAGAGLLWALAAVLVTAAPAALLLALRDATSAAGAAPGPLDRDTRDREPDGPVDG